MIDITHTVKTDIPSLSEIYVDSYNSIHIGEEWTSEKAEKMLWFFYSLQADLFFTARINKKIAGAIVAVVKPWWDGNHLIDGELFVHPTQQKKGIGRMLVLALFKEAKLKYKAVSWDTYTHVIHKHPLDWYKRLGFRTINEWMMIEGNIDTVIAKAKIK